MNKTAESSRRDFLKASAATTVGATVLSMVPAVHAAGSDIIKVGLIGCGGRGSGAADDVLNADPKTKIVAMADMFKDQLTNCLSRLKGGFADRVDVPAERSFVGFNAYKELLATDVDYVILATPPGFRPMHLDAAVDAGKN